MPDDEKKGPEEKEEAAGAPKAAAAPSKLIRWLVGAIILLVIISITGATAYYVTTKLLERRDTPVVDPESARTIDAEKMVYVFECGDPFTATLTDPEGRGGTYTLRVSVSLSVNPDAHEPDALRILQELTKRRVFIRNAIYDVLISQDPKRFVGAASAQGWGDLRAQIQKAVHDQLPPGYQVQYVLFDNPIFQGG